MMLQARWQQLSQRDQLLLALLAVVLVAYLVYQLAYRPLADARDRLAAQNAAAQTSLLSVRQLAAELARIDAEGGSQAGVPDMSLPQLVDSTAAAHQLRMSRFQPSAAGDVQIRFDSVPFANLLRWLHQLEQESGVSIKDLSLTPGNAPGLVNASLRLYR